MSVGVGDECIQVRQHAVVYWRVRGERRRNAALQCALVERVVGSETSRRSTTVIDPDCVEGVRRGAAPRILTFNPRRHCARIGGKAAQ